MDVVRAYFNRQAEIRQEPVIGIHPPATGNIVEAITHQAQPQTMHYSPGMVPAPELLPTGETLYPGETTVITPEPVFHVPGTDSTVAPATGNLLPPGTERNLGSSPPNSVATIRSRCGKLLERWTDPVTGNFWVEDFDHPDQWCWELEHPAYVPPAIGISFAAAVALAAAETADRANQDADFFRERARVADQKATALLLTAADKAEASSADAKAAQEAATGTAKDLKENADRAVEVANFDESNRATREAIATGNTIAPEMVPIAPVITVTEQAVLTNSPSRSQRPASSNMFPRGVWFADGLGSCFGGGNGGPTRRASTSRELSDRRRRKWPKVEDK